LKARSDLSLPFAGRTAGQIGLLVEDLWAGMAKWSALLGRDDWLVYTYGPHNMTNARYYDRPSRFGMRLAMIGSDPQVELIESLAGPSIYTDWITERGYGLHHIGFYVPSIGDAVSQARDAGFEPIQAAEGYGLHGDGGFAYFDTTAQLDIITELIELPSMRRPNEFMSPATAPSTTNAEGAPQ
jgi:methylmalonyl-CoA/ethylmalonyl-CoA epimerase